MAGLLSRWLRSITHPEHDEGLDGLLLVSKDLKLALQRIHRNKRVLVDVEKRHDEVVKKLENTVRALKKGEVPPPSDS